MWLPTPKYMYMYSVPIFLSMKCAYIMYIICYVICFPKNREMAGTGRETREGLCLLVLSILDTGLNRNDSNNRPFQAKLYQMHTCHLPGGFASSPWLPTGGSAPGPQTPIISSLCCARHVCYILKILKIGPHSTVNKDYH